MNEHIKQLGAAIMLQAVKDYCNATSHNTRRAIVRQLNSPWMIALTGGMSETVAEELQRNFKEISKRLMQIRT